MIGPLVNNNIISLRYGTIWYIYMRSKCDEGPALSSARHQKRKIRKKLKTKTA